MDSTMLEFQFLMFWFFCRLPSIVNFMREAILSNNVSSVKSCAKNQDTET